MLTLITGAPGAGKSLRAVHELREALASGRPCYADIAELNLPGVLPAPDDWRETPEGSFIVYDECQRRPWLAATGKPGLSDDARVRALETHRHTGHDIVFVTQRPTFLHHHVRGLVGRHVHVHRGAGLSLVNVRTWDTVQIDPDDWAAKKDADVQGWKHPKELFGLYKSATLHTHKRRIPAKLKVAGTAIALLLAGLSYLGWKSVHGFRKEEHAVPRTVAAALGSGPAHASSRPLRIVWQWTRSPRVPVVSGCISGPRGCACYSKRGRMLDLTHSECLTALMRPLPFDILGSRRGGGSGGPSRSSSAPLPAPSLLHAGPTISGISGGPGHQSGWGTRSSALRVNYQPPAYSGGHTGGALR